MNEILLLCQRIHVSHNNSPHYLNAGPILWKSNVHSGYTNTT